MSTQAGATVASEAPQVLGRSAAIAWLRVLAIVGVVCIHVSGFVVASDTVVHTSAVYYVAAVMNGAARFCVPLFVLVSGALVLKPAALADGFAPYYRKRLARLLPPLIVWQLVYLLFRVVVRGWAHDLDTIVSIVLGGKIYTALYFFWLILGLYLVAPLIILALERLTPRQRLITAVLVTATTCLWQSVLGALQWSGQSAGPGTQNIVTLWVPYVGYFALGWALRELTPTARLGWSGLAVALVGFVLLTLQVPGRLPDVVDYFSPLNYWGWFVAATTVALFCAAWWFLRAGTWGARGRIGALGDLLGSLTLGVFAIHLIVLYYLQTRFLPGLLTGHVSVRGLLGITAATIVISWSIAYVMSKVPFLRRLV